MNEAFIQQSSTGLWLGFSHPLKIIEAWVPDDVFPALLEVERLVEVNAWYAVGFVSYEAAPGFDKAFRCTVHKSNFSPPLLYFALYAAPTVLTAAQLFVDALENRQTTTTDTLAAWLASVDRETYDLALTQIRRRIACGDTYQVNYTWRLQRQFTADPKHWFQEMVATQCPRHAAYLDNGQFLVLSASLELFFSLDGRRLITRPMKGTAARAPAPSEDQAQVAALRASAKERAENVMIVDMMRNDLGRIALLGSVQVANLFAIEQYPTVWQLTSTVAALTDQSVSEIFRALFPAASVTGAPKAHTMGIIADLETTPRGIYTGAIGFIAPGRRAEFNVAIRTMVVERATGIAHYGVGGGIVWDSQIDHEYAECLSKARFLWTKWPRFSLLETLLWRPLEGFFLLTEHLDRICGAAAYFDYQIDRDAIQRALTAISAHFSHTPQRVRLLLDQNGIIQTEAAPFIAGVTEVALALATTAIDASDPFFYHKTTNRVAYERARRQCAPGMEILLWNERGEITETTSANVVVIIDGKRITPPITAGLLAGTYRRHLLESGAIHEGTIKLTDLTPASELWVINSVRGWQRARLYTDIVS